MQIILPWLGQAPDLANFERLPFSPGVEAGPRPGDRHVELSALVAHEPPGPPLPGGPFERLARAILAYRVFPTWAVRGLVRRAPLEAGDTFASRFAVLPGLELVFGGRVVEAFDGPGGPGWRAGFRFHTLRGHPRCGEETFWAHKDEQNGEVWAGLRSWSRPGSRLFALAEPYARWMQVRAARAALRQFRRVAHASPCSERINSSS